MVTFEQFDQALSELATKRFKGKSQEEALQEIYGLVVGKEPANQGITVSPAAPESIIDCEGRFSVEPILDYEPYRTLSK